MICKILIVGRSVDRTQELSYVSCDVALSHYDIEETFLPEATATHLPVPSSFCSCTPQWRSEFCVSYWQSPTRVSYRGGTSPSIGTCVVAQPSIRTQAGFSLGLSWTKTSLLRGFTELASVPRSTHQVPSSGLFV